jgi:hypothetical protein
MSITNPRRPSSTSHGNVGATGTPSPATTVGTTGLGGTAPRTDTFVPPLRGGAVATVLPDVLLEVRGFKVVHGTDPGDFYCEHMFFQSQSEARKPNASVTVNDKGEKLVGFLHIPSDSATYSGVTTEPQEERHAATRDVVGSALRGYYDEASQRVARGPVRLMLNGYGSWGSTVNNPTGDFVRHSENVDAAMKTAFGDALVTPKGQPYTGPDAAPAEHSTVLQYVVQDPKSRVTRTVLVRTQQFPVTDDAINGNGTVSVQYAMGGFKPHAVLSMGVGTPTYTAEFHADNGGLKLDGSPTHDDSAAPSVNLPENRSLARAIHGGAAAIVAEAGRVPAPTTSPAQPVANAANTLVANHASSYGVDQPWFNQDPNHALPVNTRLGGLSGKWKSNLFGGNALALGGFEPPYYGNKGKGEYPNANQFYKWSDKYATRFGNKSHFELRGELAPQDLPAQQREAAIKELLKKAQPGDLILVDHVGDAVADGGHVRVAVGTLQDDGTIQCAQASRSAAETHKESAADFSGEERVWVLRPNRPRAAPAPR